MKRIGFFDWMVWTFIVVTLIIVSNFFEYWFYRHKIENVDYRLAAQAEMGAGCSILVLLPLFVLGIVGIFVFLPKRKDRMVTFLFLTINVVLTGCAILMSFF